MLHAAVSLAFFGLLRSAESLLHRPREERPTALVARDISIINKILIVTIRKSKMDPYKEGVIIRIGPNYSKVCPVSAMSRSLLSSSHSSGPLF